MYMYLYMCVAYVCIPAPDWEVARMLAVEEKKRNKLLSKAQLAEKRETEKFKLYGPIGSQVHMYICIVLYKNIYLYIYVAVVVDTYLLTQTQYIHSLSLTLIHTCTSAPICIPTPPSVRLICVFICMLVYVCVCVCIYVYVYDSV